MATATTNLYLTKSGYVKEESPSTVFPTNSSTIYYCTRPTIYTVEGKRLYLGFENISSSLKNRRIYSMRLRLQSGFANMYANACDSDFNPSTLCWDNAPAAAKNTGSDGYLRSYPDSDEHEFIDRWFTESSGATGKVTPFFFKARAFFVQATVDVWNEAKTVLSGGGLPYVEITYDDSVNVKSKITLQSGPSSGYMDPRNARTFTWAFLRDETETYYCAGDFTQQSAALKWKEAGDETWNTVSASGSTTSLTVPANTFPAATDIEWYLTGTDTAGTTSETPHYTFSTEAGSVSVTPISPINTVEDGTQDIRFSWDFISTDGQPPAYVDLQFQAPGSDTWTSEWSHVAATDHAIIPGGTFSSGENKWRVRAYNIDDLAGAWSSYNGNPPSFICIGAPAAPAGLDATEVPRTTISWQASGQEAYEIEIDGRSVQQAYDPSASSWQPEEPLEDGTHTIRVRVQGVYGLWSAWSSVVISVLNDPPSTAALTGNFRTDAILTFVSEDVLETPVIQWYRDGRRIGRTVGTFSFADRVVLGEHSYYAEMWYDSGYYVRTNTVSGKLCVHDTRISLTDYGSEWLPLKLSENSNSMQNFTWSRQSSLRHMRGAVYPVLELGEEENLIGSYDAAFRTAQEARELEEMKGRTVIIKSRGGQVLIGALTKLQKRVKDFYITCSFSIQQIHWEDFVNNDQNS